MTTQQAGVTSPSDRARALVQGAYDLHVHVAPDVPPRRIDDRALARRIDAAARRGGVSYFTSGIEPGFMSDTLPLVLTGISQWWRGIRVQAVRFVTADVALADGSYFIVGSDLERWTTIVLTRDGGTWRIAAIRNMTPVRPARPPG